MEVKILKLLHVTKCAKIKKNIKKWKTYAFLKIFTLVKNGRHTKTAHFGKIPVRIESYKVTVVTKVTGTRRGFDGNGQQIREK